MALLLTLLILGPQVWAILRDMHAGWRLAALVLSVAACVAALLLKAPVLGVLRGAEPSQTDTYYIVASAGGFGLAIGLTVAFVAFVWATQRVAGPLPRPANWLATLLALLFWEVLMRLFYLPIIISRLNAKDQDLRSSSPVSQLMDFVDGAILVLPLVLGAICVMVWVRHIRHQRR